MGSLTVFPTGGINPSMEGFFGILEGWGDFFIRMNFLAFSRIFQHFGFLEVYFGLKGVNHNIFSIFPSKYLNSLHFVDFTIKKQQQYTARSTVLQPFSLAELCYQQFVTLYLALLYILKLHNSRFSWILLLH